MSRLAPIYAAIAIFPLIAAGAALPYVALQYRRHGALGAGQLLLAGLFALYLVGLTFAVVLPLRPDAAIASLVTAGLSTVAIRVPAHRAMQALLAATGKPLAAPSANASGGISPTLAEHVIASLGNAVPVIVDDGAPEKGLESTIVMGVRILRPGPITEEMLFPCESRGPGLSGAVAGNPGLLLSQEHG